MQVKERLRCITALLLAGIVTVMFSGCQTPPAVLAVTGTVIGVEISQNPATQLYQAKLGYNRAEFAMVYRKEVGSTAAGQTGSAAAGQTGPTVLGQTGPTTPGQTGQVDDVPNVLMELCYGGLGTSSIYQRLAVGMTAVSQPASSNMFIKDAKGEVSTSAATASQANADASKAKAKADAAKAQAAVALAQPKVAQAQADAAKAQADAELAKLQAEREAIKAVK